MNPTDKLTDAAHEKCLEHGEHLAPVAMADLVLEIETTTGYEFTADEIRRAHYVAGERWVESEISNILDSVRDGRISEENALTRKAALEAQRPSVRRRAAILSALA